MTLFHREAEGNSHLMRDPGGGKFLHSVKLLSLFMKNIATVNIRASNWFRHFCCTISRRDSHITHM